MSALLWVVASQVIFMTTFGATINDKVGINSIGRSYGDNWSITHWGRVTHICVNKLTIIGSDNGLSPGRHQAIIWTNAEILLTGSLGTKFSEIFIEIHTFSFKKMHMKMSSGKWRPFCLRLNVITTSKHNADYE